MKILITGGIGFVGSRLVPLLQQNGYETAVIDKRNITEEDVECEFIHGSICDQDALDKACRGCDAIIHLAAEHKDNVRPISLYDDVNIEGTKNVCLAARVNNINKIIFTSSVAVYGLNTLANEETVPQPFNDYGRTKFAAEEVLKEWQDEDLERSLTLVRPTVIFGENNRGNVYNLLKQIALGPFIMIGNGKNKKAMAYVGNVADFLLRSLSFSSGIHLYNYADTPQLDMNELISVVKTKLGKSESIGLRLPKTLAYVGGALLDAVAVATKKEFPISRVRVKKFTADTIYGTDHLNRLYYKRPFDMMSALENTIRNEFIDNN